MKEVCVRTGLEPAKVQTYLRTTVVSYIQYWYFTR